MSRYRGVNGVAREVTTRYRGVGGVARAITKGYRGVNGVARQFFFALRLAYKVTNSRGATITTDTENGRVYASVSGGNGTNWAQAAWRVPMKKGQTAVFSFSGTRAAYGGYADYGVAFMADESTDVSARIYGEVNADVEKSVWTATQDCYCFVFAQIGGVENSGLAATIELTELTIDGNAVYPLI